MFPGSKVQGIQHARGDGRLAGISLADFVRRPRSLSSSSNQRRMSVKKRRCRILSDDGVSKGNFNDTCMSLVRSDPDVSLLNEGLANGLLGLEAHTGVVPEGLNGRTYNYLATYKMTPKPSFMLCSPLQRKVLVAGVETRTWSFYR